MSIIRETYTDEYYGKVRTIFNTETDEMLFCANDVAKELGFADPGRTVRRACGKLFKEVHITEGGLQVMNFIDIHEVDNLAERSKDVFYGYEYTDFLNFLKTEFYENHPEYCAYDVAENGYLSDFCIGNCRKCDYTHECEDYCDEDCDDCPCYGECYGNDDSYSEEVEYEDTHNPDFLKMLNEDASEFSDAENQDELLKIGEELVHLAIKLLKLNMADNNVEE